MLVFRQRYQIDTVDFKTEKRRVIKKKKKRKRVSILTLEVQRIYQKLLRFIDKNEMLRL